MAMLGQSRPVCYDAGVTSTGTSRLIVGFLILISCSAVAAQETDPSQAEGVVADWIRLNETPERLTHENRTELTVLARDIRSGSMQRARSAIARIEAIAEERREIVPELTDLLVFVVADPFVEERRGQGAGALSPLIRIRALDLLGDMGGRSARNGMLITLRQERDPTVVRAALNALAKMAPEPTPDVIRGLAGVLRKPDLRDHPGVVSAALRAVRRIDRAPYSIQDPELFLAIMEIGRGPFPRSVRAEAYDVLDQLRRR
jgi:hypothetical protein